MAIPACENLDLRICLTAAAGTLAKRGKAKRPGGGQCLGDGLCQLSPVYYRDYDLALVHCPPIKGERRRKNLRDVPVSALGPYPPSPNEGRSQHTTAVT